MSRSPWGAFRAAGRSAGRATAGAVLYGLFSFLSVAGLVAVAFGLLYRLDARQVPHLLQGADHWRGDFCLLLGAACLAVAWLLRRWQKRSLAAGCRASDSVITEMFAYPRSVGA